MNNGSLQGHEQEATQGIWVLLAKACLPNTRALRRCHLGEEGEAHAFLACIATSTRGLADVLGPLRGKHVPGCVSRTHGEERQAHVLGGVKVEDLQRLHPGRPRQGNIS